jgi:hypothetical protein
MAKLDSSTLQNNSALESSAPDVPPTSEGISRRSLMNMMTAVAAVPTVAFATPVIAEPATDRSEWDRNFAAYQEAKAADEAFNKIFDPIHDQRTAEVESLPLKDLPPDRWLGRVRSPIGAGERRYHIRQSKRSVEEFDAGKVRLDEYVRADYEKHIAVCREVVAIDAQHAAAVEAIEKRLGYVQALERWEALGEASYDAEWRVMETPAPDGAALLFKLEKLLEVEQDGSIAPWSESAVRQTVLDMRRVLGTL